MNAEEKKKYDKDLELRHWREKRDMNPKYIAEPKQHVHKHKYPIWAEIDRCRL